MTITFCNRCGKLVDHEVHYSIVATRFLSDGSRDGDERHKDLCYECYQTIDVTHLKTKVLEDAITCLNKK